MVEVDWAVSDKGKSGQPDHGGGKEDYRFRGPLSGGGARGRVSSGTIVKRLEQIMVGYMARR